MKPQEKVSGASMVGSMQGGELGGCRVAALRRDKTSLRKNSAFVYSRGK